MLEPTYSMGLIGCFLQMRSVYMRILDNFSLLKIYCFRLLPNVSNNMDWVKFINPQVGLPIWSYCLSQ